MGPPFSWLECSLLFTRLSKSGQSDMVSCGNYLSSSDIMVVFYIAAETITKELGCLSEE